MNLKKTVAIVFSALIICVPSVSAAVSGGPTWSDVQRRGTEALDANKYWIAEPLLKEAVIRAGAFGLNDIRTAKSFGELGRLYTIRGRFELAEPYLEEELNAKKLALGEEHETIVPAMGSLIQFYLNYGSAEKAPPLTEEMLTLIQGKLKEPTSLSNGPVKYKQGVALEAWAGEAGPGERDPIIEWAIACDAVGNTYRLKDQYDRAYRLFKAALDLKTTVLGKEHLSLANSYDNLGTLCQQNNNLAEAEGYYRDSLSITQKILTNDNPAAYTRFDKLARCLIKENKLPDAEALYQQALTFWKSDNSPSADQARALYALGSIYSQQKKYDQAAGVLQQALTVAEQVHGPDSANLVPYLNQYAYVLYYLKRKPEWEALKARASTISGV